MNEVVLVFFIDAHVGSLTPFPARGSGCPSALPSTVVRGPQALPLLMSATVPPTGSITSSASRLMAARDVLFETRHHRPALCCRDPHVMGMSIKTRSLVTADATNPFGWTNEPARGQRADARAILWGPADHLRARQDQTLSAS